VRIGLHAGITYLIDEQTRDLHGNDVNVAFRLESIQKSAFDTLEAEFPEQDRVLCTKVFYDKLKDQVISLDVSFVRCGMAALKGIKEPIEVYWVR
jgi:class 3 adenylate cyclase